jgi:ferredoxin-NADP reductase
MKLKGPEFQYTLPQDTEEVLFIAGGTGIAPALQVANALETPMGNTRMHILWANRKRDECLGVNTPDSNALLWLRSLGRFLLPLPTTTSQGDAMEPSSSAMVRELELLKMRSQGLLTIDYFVDDEQSFITKGRIGKHLGSRTRRSHRARQGSEAKEGRRIIMISGPDGFIGHFAGQKVWVNGREEQGELGGILKQLDLSGWEVVKI